MAYLSNAILENPLAKPGKPYRNRKYLRFVSQKQCSFCGVIPAGQAHHIRWGDTCGMGTKPSDIFSIPACPECHRAIHQMTGERYKTFISPAGNDGLRLKVMEQMLNQAEEWIREH